jgi:hypothetical protein
VTASRHCPRWAIHHSRDVAVRVWCRKRAVWAAACSGSPPDALSRTRTLNWDSRERRILFGPQSAHRIHRAGSHRGNECREQGEAAEHGRRSQERDRIGRSDFEQEPGEDATDRQRAGDCRTSGLWQSGTAPSRPTPSFRHRVAMRIPISRRRSATEDASTPYTPTAADRRATTETLPRGESEDAARRLYRRSPPAST